MPNYTLYYFNGRGRAEICRMMFAAAGVKYTDKRFEFNEWDKYRKDFPCNYLPCLEMDGGFRAPETISICRYLARQYTLRRGECAGNSLDGVRQLTHAASVNDGEDRELSSSTFKEPISEEESDFIPRPSRLIVRSDVNVDFD